MIDLIAVADRVIAALDLAGIPYSVGGSIASSFSGEPRASIDVDILVDMRYDQIPAFVEAIAQEFYADADALHRAVATRSSSNLIHQASGIKVDIFVAGSILDRQQLERRRRVKVDPQTGHEWFIHSPEDILLQKLLWYQSGGEVSERQWRDVLAIVAVQGTRLDRGYLTSTAARAGLTELLSRLPHDAGGKTPA